MTNTPQSTLVRGLLALALSTLVLLGCGGGVGTGGTGSYAQGPITGFGSIVVNGVHYDDSSAVVLDAAGAAHGAGDLKLGMTVEIDSGPIASAAGGESASATLIRYASELYGPLAGVDRAGGVLTLLGQTVQTDAGTVVDDRLAGGIGALAVGQPVAVYAAFDPATARYRATRVEPAAASAVWQLRGPVSQLDAAAHRLHIGAAVFDYGGAAAVPAGLADGQFVRLQLQAGAAPGTAWTVLSFASAATVPSDGREATVKGLISAFTSTTSFSVNGQPVTATGASFPEGSAGLAPGVRVEVEGTVQGGVLQASQVAIDGDAAEHGSFELRGAISAIDVLAQTFTLRGVVVGYGGVGIVFDGGNAADLAPNQQVEVRGSLSADGTRIEATMIKFDH